MADMTDDQTLVSQVLQGDTQAFLRLIRKYERLVAHMVGRLVKHDGEREEICQDVFMRVYEKLGEFTFQSRLSTWIATIAYRYAINHLRKKKLDFTELDDVRVAGMMVETENPETVFSEQDSHEFVLALIDKLPPQYKTVLTLYHVEGMNYAEIGQVTEMPEGTVKSYLFRARNLLKEKVKSYLGKEELL
jgi:RNA polymerase sigma-70 factor (ECF subfamily)